MPYIEQHRRDKIYNPINKTINLSEICNPGEINYAVFLTMLQYKWRFGNKYEKMNDLLGAVGESQAEFRRRFLGPKEDIAIIKNGDIIL